MAKLSLSNDTNYKALFPLVKLAIKSLVKQRKSTRQKFLPIEGDYNVAPLMISSLKWPEIFMIKQVLNSQE